MAPELLLRVHGSVAVSGELLPPGVRHSPEAGAGRRARVSRE